MLNKLFAKKNHTINTHTTKAKTKTITHADVDKRYQTNDSITDWLPWLDYCPQTETFTLEDGYSVAAMFEIIGVPSEARPEQFMQEVQAQFQTCINHSIPQKDDPFVLQVFVQDEDSLSDFYQHFKSYIPNEQQQDAFSQHFLGQMQAHIKRISNPEGYFVDSAVTGSAWNGKQRRVRVFLYRRVPLGNNQRRASQRGNRQTVSPDQEMNEVAASFSAQMQSTGAKIRRCNAFDLYEMLVRWFNPKAEFTDGDIDQLIKSSYSHAEDKPFGYDLSTLVMMSQPRSDNTRGLWYFDEMPHRAISIDALRRKPEIGHITGERKIGDNIYAMFDKMPSGAILSFAIVIQPQDLVENKIIQILNASKGETAEALSTERDSSRALSLMASGDYLFPTVTTLFLRAEDVLTLERNTNEANALLLANGFHPIKERDEQLALNTYITQLPMNYEPARDKKEKKSRLIFSSDLAKLLPFYGRSRGTGHPGFVFYNRGAEPLTFDPLNKLDRSKNAFGLVLGPPGSGKSSLMVYLLLQITAIYKARIYIVEKGGSFSLFGDYCQHFGLSVNQVTLNPKNDISLPPFGDAFLMLENEAAKQRLDEASEDDGSLDGSLDSSLDNSDSSDDEEDERDYLGEMELKARVMITGGDVKEEAQMTRADRLSIRKAIVNAAKAKKAEIDTAKQQGTPLNARQQQVMTEDVVNALLDLAKDNTVTDKRRERARDMGDAMALYCSGTAGRFFNRPGNAWPEADVTILEMGLLANEGYEDQLALGFMGLMNQINSVVEREQYSQRPTFVLVDEAHLITTNMLLAPYLVKIVKMWRKLGAWLWLATQNMEDFPNSAKKLLGMFEWWFAMVCPKEQIDQIARFKDLTSEQKAMLLAAHKEPGKYTEGVVIADKVQALFRNVPPPLALALAMTEKHEKRERAVIMEELGCSELEAVFEVVDRMVG